jgi:hypothetical protein
MGCGGSVPDRAAQVDAPPSPMVTNAEPSTTPRGDPPSYRQAAWGQPQRAQGQYLQPYDHPQPPRPVDVQPDRNTLIHALDHMGRYLNHYGVMACAVTVGGLVNTIYLQTKESTRDINLFSDDPNSPADWYMDEAARSAARASGGTRGVPLNENWVTNASQIVRDRHLGTRLMMEAQQQNVVVYQYRDERGGLLIYAAPWAYAFCGKLEQLGDANQNQQYVNDAVLYLHEYLRCKNRSGVSTSEVGKWCQEYQKIVTDAALHHVNIQYYHVYGQKVIYR